MKRYRKMTTAQLDELLQAELRKVTPDEEVVLPILEVLEEREQKLCRKNRQIIRWAAVAAVLALLIAVVPKVAGTDSLWDVMLHVTDSFVQFFTPGDAPDPTEAEYVFETDNPGLRQTYDKITDLGVTVPVVPMWLPEEYEFAGLSISNQDDYIKLTSLFKMGNEEIVMTYKICGEVSATQYECVREQVEVYEAGRSDHAITKNTENWVVTWGIDNVECLITADVNKEDIYKIIQSIYRRTTR